MTEVDVDVVVVGAGLAGLAAARAVVAGGATTMVVEARDRVGGRLLNEPIGDGQVVEVGGQWVGPTQDRVLALTRELGLQTYPTYGVGDKLVRWDGKLIRYRGTIPRISVPALADVAQAQFRLERLVKRVPADAPWTAKGADDLDGETFQTWLRRTARTRAGRTLMTMALEAVWAQDPRDVSLLHVLFYIRSAGGFDILVDTEGGAQAERFVGGSQLLALGMAERLGAERILLESPVTRIDHGDDGVVVHATGSTVRAQHAVVALPPALAGRLVYEPALPAQRDGVTQRMTPGSVVKCMAIYDEPFWRGHGLCGQALEPEGPAKIIYDNSPPSGSPGVLLGFLEGRAARRLGAASQDERRIAVTECFARLFGPRARTPERYVDKVWADDPWTRGCYGGSLPPGGWTDFGPALWAPIGRLHWAGAETATVWNGYMDGALQSGERAAGEALERL